MIAKIKKFMKSALWISCPYPAIEEIKVNWDRLSYHLVVAHTIGLVMCQVIENQQIVIEQLRKERGK